jgi:homoserine kinase
MTRARIQVPATSANLGPGFDSLALALDLCNTFTVELDPASEEVVLPEVTGEHTVPADPHDNLVCRAYRAWASDTDSKLPGARFHLESHIPIGKGFGSSAAAIVGGLAAGALATKDKHPREKMIRLSCRLEGHADNAVAAILGGATVAFMRHGDVHALQVATHLDLGVGFFVPDDPLPTAEARAALPEQVPMKDAVSNVGRAAYLVAALAWGRWELIGPAMHDRLHQPYRARLIAALDEVIEAAGAGGAYGAALSGGGPAVIALGPKERAQAFTAAMEAAAEAHKWPGTGLVSSVRHLGVQVSIIPQQ